QVRREALVEVVVSTVGSIAEASMSSDGRAVIYVADQPDSFVLTEVRPRRPPKQLLVLARTMEPVRPGYGRDSKEVFYQHERKIWVLRGGKSQVVSTLDQLRSGL